MYMYFSSVTHLKIQYFRWQKVKQDFASFKYKLSKQYFFTAFMLSMYPTGVISTIFSWVHLEATLKDYPMVPKQLKQLLKSGLHFTFSILFIHIGGSLTIITLLVSLYQCLKQTFSGTHENINSRFRQSCSKCTMCFIFIILYPGTIVFLLYGLIVFTNVEWIYSCEIDVNKYYHYNTDHYYNNNLDSIQYTYKCCGVHSYKDYNMHPYGYNRETLPVSCCQNSFNGCNEYNTYKSGCLPFICKTFTNALRSSTIHLQYIYIILLIITITLSYCIIKFVFGSCCTKSDVNLTDLKDTEVISIGQDEEGEDTGEDVEDEAEDNLEILE